MKVDNYTYDGMASLYCNKCHVLRTISFDGADDQHPEDAIEEALAEIGWDVQNGICPDCRDPEEVKREWDEDSCEDEPYDEYEDYELDTNEDEND